MHIADNRLAHVVLCAGLDAAELLDRYPGFRARRQRVFIDFPRDSTVDFYFHRVVNPFLRDMLGAVPRPAPPKLPLPPVGAARQPASSSAGSLPVGPAAEGVEDSPNRQPVRAVAEVARPLALPRRSGSWMEWWRGSSSGGDATSLLSDHSRSGLHSETKLPQSAEPSVVAPSAAVLPQAEKESLDFLGDVEQTPTAASKVRETLKDTVKAPSLASPELQVERNLASSLALSPTKESALALDTTSIGVVSGEGQPPAIAAPPQPAPILAAVPALLKGDALPQPLPPAADPSTEQLSAPGAATAMPVAAARAAIRAQQAAAAAAAAQKSQQTNASDPSQVPRPASTVDVYAADSSVPVLEAEAATGAAAAPLSQAAASTPPHGKLPSAFSSHSGTAALPKVCGGPEGVGLVDASQSSVPNRRLSGAGASAVLHRPRDMVSVDTAAIFGNGPAGEVTDDIFLLTPEEIATIVATVGGHLQDLLTVVTAVTRGQSWGEALERLVADSAEAVEHILDAILDVPGGVAAGGAAVAAQAAGRRNTRSGSAGFASGLPAHDFQTHPGPARLAAYGRYARAWALLSALGDRRYVSRRELTTLIFPACPHELDYLVASGLVTSRALGGGWRKCVQRP